MPTQEAASLPRWRTRANLLTGARLLLAAPLAAAILHPAPLAAAAVFWLAVATDLLDGRVARRRGESSPLGGLLDHATDATFVAVGLGAAAAAGEVPWPLPPLVLAAFVQYALDSRALRGHELRTSALGRRNGIAYFALLGVPVVRDALGLEVPPPGVVVALGWLLVLSTLVSMTDRALALRRARRAAR